MRLALHDVTMAGGGAVLPRLFISLLMSGVVPIKVRRVAELRVKFGSTKRPEILDKEADKNGCGELGSWQRLRDEPGNKQLSGGGQSRNISVRE